MDYFVLSKFINCDGLICSLAQDSSWNTEKYMVWIWVNFEIRDSQNTRHVVAVVVPAFTSCSSRLLYHVSPRVSVELLLSLSERWLWGKPSRTSFFSSKDNNHGGLWFKFGNSFLLPMLFTGVLRTTLVTMSPASRRSLFLPWAVCFQGV